MRNKKAKKWMQYGVTATYVGVAAVLMITGAVAFQPSAKEVYLMILEAAGLFLLGFLAGRVKKQRKTFKRGYNRGAEDAAYSAVYTGIYRIYDI